MPLLHPKFYHGEQRITQPAIPKIRTCKYSTLHEDTRKYYQFPMVDTYLLIPDHRILTSWRYSEFNRRINQALGYDTVACSKKAIIVSGIRLAVYH
jgi:hypothetical protein